MKILHTADLQLGKRQYGSLTRTKDFAAVLSQISQIIKDHKVDLLVLAGDIFDSYSPDSFSEKAFRQFVESLKVPCIAIEGNHEFDKRNIAGREVARIDSVTDMLMRSSTYNQIGGHGIKIACADWMPQTKIDGFLSSLDPDLDVLIMHQSCEGFIPSIGHTELKLDQLIGRAKIILLGDLHVAKTVVLKDGTVVTYPGSTEMCASNEPSNKSVNLISYNTVLRKVEDITLIPLKTRPVLKFTATSELSLLEVDREITGRNDNPIVFLNYCASIRPLIQNKLIEWSSAGNQLIQANQMVEVDENESFAAQVHSADTEMSEVLISRIQNDDLVRDSSVAIWKNPGSILEIFRQIEQQIREKYSAKS